MEACSATSDGRAEVGGQPVEKSIHVVAGWRLRSGNGQPKLVEGLRIGRAGRGQILVDQVERDLWRARVRQPSAHEEVIEEAEGSETHSSVDLAAHAIPVLDDVLCETGQE